MRKDHCLGDYHVRQFNIHAHIAAQLQQNAVEGGACWGLFVVQLWVWFHRRVWWKVGKTTRQNPVDPTNAQRNNPVVGTAVGALPLFVPTAVALFAVLGFVLGSVLMRESWSVCVRWRRR